MQAQYFYYRYFIVFLIFFLFHNNCNSKEYTLSDITRVENQAIANREKIKDWHLRVSLSDEQMVPSSDYVLDEEEEGQLLGIEFYKDGDQYREDKSYLFKGKKIIRSMVLGEKWYYRFGSDLVRKKDTNIDIPLLNMTAREKQVQTNIIRTFHDIRTFGFNPTNLRFSPKELTKFIGNSSRKDLVMEDDIVKGEPCYKISFSLIDHPEKNNNIVIWLSPNCGYNPLKFEFFFPDIPGTQKTIFDIEVNKDKDSGIWFPATQKTTVFRNEKIFYQYNEKIEVISLNKKLDPNLFNEKGLNLPIGTLAMMDPEPAHDTFTWDGEQIVGLSGLTLEPFVIPPRSNTFRYFLIAVSLALISVGCLLRYLELRKKK
jgi:hypothetical protein